MSKVILFFVILSIFDVVTAYSEEILPKNGCKVFTFQLAKYEMDEDIKVGSHVDLVWSLPTGPKVLAENVRVIILKKHKGIDRNFNDQKRLDREYQVGIELDTNRFNEYNDLRGSFVLKPRSNLTN